jgi:hypothetical protein
VARRIGVAAGVGFGRITPGVAQELAPQLESALVALGQDLQRPRLERALRLGASDQG